MNSTDRRIYDCFLIAAGGLSLGPKIGWQLMNEYFSCASDIVSGNFKKAPDEDCDTEALESFITKSRGAAADSRRREAAEKAIERYIEFGEKLSREYGQQVRAQVLTIFDEGYPEALRHISNAPIVLFMAGAKFDAKSENFAVVGTREPSNYSLALCEKITEGISGAGYVIASGMAMGIDACAHAAAIKSGGVTYAVVATGLDIVYPAANRKLYGDILLSGAVLSEQLPGEGAKNYSFVARNRIITGISKATLVCGAGFQSGALISAKCAFEQSREVFAITGDDFRPDLKGCHELIRKNYAKLALNSADILNDICPEKIKKSRLDQSETRAFKKDKKADATAPLEFDGARAGALSEDEKKVFDSIERLCVKNSEPPALELIAENSEGLGAGRVLAAISGLELKGLIIEHDGKRYRIKK